MEKNARYFIGRQPILNRESELVGFELLFRAAADHESALFDNQGHAAASVISTMLSTFGFKELLGGKNGFINITTSILESEVLELLPVELSVLELLETIELDNTTLMHCCALKALGFKIALDDHRYDPRLFEFYNLVDIIKIDLLTTDSTELPQIVAALKQYPAKLLAERVETMEVFKSCRDLGFDLFQGYFFERPAVISHKRLGTSAIALMKLLQQLHEENDLDTIESIFQENPALTYQLLRLVNSVMVGPRDKIKSIRHAIMLLGIMQLRRWIQLSLYVGNGDHDADNPLLEMAAVRGRLMEELAGLSTMQQRNAASAEVAFLTGILSLLDVLHETTMERIVEELNLSEELGNALLKHEGTLGRLLLLVKKVEHSEFGEVQWLIDSLAISRAQLLQAQCHAFDWRRSVTGKNNHSSS